MEGDPLPPPTAAIPDTDDPDEIGYEITEHDLIAAILAAVSAGGHDDGGGLTTAELCLKTGKSDKWVRGKLWALKRAGRLEAGRARREGLTGQTVFVPVYRLAKESPAD